MVLLFWGRHLSSTQNTETTLRDLKDAIYRFILMDSRKKGKGHKNLYLEKINIDQADSYSQKIFDFDVI